MSQTYKTEQEEFWAGNFGDEYIGRNCDDSLPARVALFSRMFARTAAVGSAIELGANIGLNLRALKALFPELGATAVEINTRAAAELRQHDWIEVHETSILEYEAAKGHDFAFTSGVMIHINPDELEKVYQALHAASNRYIGVIEYYSPAPVEVSYRGHGERLFKRDFAGEMMDMFGDLKLVDYGFVYHRDPVFPLGDMNWFLLEKQDR
jgi:spore coat polysaccharide biosynthesis protein SpsF